jgi:hypothetical protein
MKKYIGLLLAALIALPLFAQTEHEPQDRMGLIFPVVGYKRLNLRHNSFNAITADMTLHNLFNDIDFNGSFHWGKDYMSMEPFSLVGLMCIYFWKYGEGTEPDNSMFKLIVFAGAISSMSFNIRIGETVNIRPYWSLLRLTKLTDEKNKAYYNEEKGTFKLNGALGTHVTLEFGRIMVNPYVEWTFGWKKDSPFRGYAFGASVGIKLYSEDSYY